MLSVVLLNYFQPWVALEGEALRLASTAPVGIPVGSRIFLCPPVPTTVPTQEPLLRDSLQLNVSPVLGAGVCPVSSSLFWVQKTIVDFSVCPGFHSFLGHSDNSHAPSVQNSTRGPNGFCSPGLLLPPQSGLRVDRMWVEESHKELALKPASLWLC